MYSTSSFFHIRFIVFACLLGASGQASAQDVPANVMEQVLRDANARAAAGQSPAVVERFIADRLEQAGMSLRVEPSAWDVYGRAEWRAEERSRLLVTPEQPSSDSAVAVTMHADHLDEADGNQAASAQAHVLRAQPPAPGTSVVVRGGTGGSDSQSGRKATVHFQGERGLDAQGAADMEARVLHAHSAQQGGSLLQRP